MSLRTTWLPIAGLLGAIAAVSLTHSEAAQQARTIPQSARLENEAIVRQITALADQPAPVGPEARKLLALVQPHLLLREEVVLPPLTLLPLIAQGKVTSDMKWALPLIDRAKAGQQQNLRELEQITAQLNALAAAGEQANDGQAFKTAQDIAASLLADEELTQPTVVLIGDYLRARLPAGS
jgi:hypothetical protein